MTNEELVPLIQANQNRQKNLEELYLQNIGLLKKICNKYKAITATIEYDDLMQQSFLALVKAVDLWEPEQGYSFSTYLFKAVQSELLRYIHENDSSIRLPDYMANLVYRYKQLRSRYIQRYGTEPPDSHLCDALQISHGQLTRLKGYSYSIDIKSLSESISEDSDATLADCIPDPVNQFDKIDDRIIRGELAEVLMNAVNKLKEDQQTVIRSYYADEKTMPEISADTGIDVRSVSRLRNTALEELWRRNKSQLLPYCEIYGIATKGNSASNFNRTWTSSTERAALRLLERTKNELL